MPLTKQASSKIPCVLRDLGLISYAQAYQKQQRALQEVLLGGCNILLLCEHPPVFTRGRSDKEDNFLFPVQQIQEKGIDIISVNRGGQITFHGPGQLVAYPIFSLDLFGKDLRKFMHRMEQVIIDLLQDFGIVANRISGRTGVWVDQKKIASIGLGVRQWVSCHGLGLNINTDLKFFDMIKPCGLDIKMTSMQEYIHEPADIKKVKIAMIDHFQKMFSLNILDKNGYGD